MRQRREATTTRVSISGYHIAEAGANPISAARLHAVERIHTSSSTTWRAACTIDDFAPNLSFLLLQRHGPGVHRDRAAWRGASGRCAMKRTLRRQPAQPDAEVPHPDLEWPFSLHAQEIQLQRYPHDACRHSMPCSTITATRLHTNAYDEAITTPTEESVRRAVAIQLVINRELGPELLNENPWQGSFIVEELTDLVEEAVLRRVREASRSVAACSARWRPATNAARSRKRACTTRCRSTPASIRSSA